MGGRLWRRLLVREAEHAELLELGDQSRLVRGGLRHDAGGGGGGGGEGDVLVISGCYRALVVTLRGVGTGQLALAASWRATFRVEDRLREGGGQRASTGPKETKRPLNTKQVPVPSHLHCSPLPTH